MTTIKYTGLLAVVAVLGYWLLPAPPRDRSASAETAQDVAYLCKETKKVIKAPPQAVPAINPQTGRATLYRALYCGQCKAWKAVPPPDVFPGNPLTYPCPKHNRQMTAAGPIERRN